MNNSLHQQQQSQSVSPISKIPMRIRVFLSWDTPEVTKQNVETEFNLFSVPGYKRDFELTSGEDYTHAIVVNTFMPNLNVPKENVVGFAWEPNPLLRLHPQFVEYAKQKIGRYLIGEKGALPYPFKETYAFLNHTPMQSYIAPKTKICSVIFSKKQFMEGHQYRNRIVEAILKTNLPIDIWGRGCDTIAMKDPRLKGEFVQNSVLPYQDYEFHICIENICLNHYYSEKIVNALLSNCTPIYYGCKKIHQYFPKEIVQLCGDVEKDMEIITRCIKNPELYKKAINRDEVHKIVNPFFQLDTLFS
jgi:hypothetical protein